MLNLIFIPRFRKPALLLTATLAFAFLGAAPMLKAAAVVEMSDAAQSTGDPVGAEWAQNIVATASGDIYIAYVTSAGGNPMATVVAKRTAAGVWSYSTIQSDTPNDQGHTAPSLALDSNGYIHVFYGMHNHALNTHYKRSNQPYSVSGGWTTGFPDSSAATYPLLTKASDGNLYLTVRIYSGLRHRLYKWNGTTWSNLGDWLAETNYTPYVFDVYPDASGNLHFGFSWVAGGPDEFRHLGCYIRYNVATNTFHKADGTQVAKPITRATADKFQNLEAGEVFGDGTFGVTNEKLTLNSSGQPVITYLYPPNHTTGGHNLYAARWNGTSWVRATLYNGANLNPYGTGDIASSSGELRFYHPTTGSRQQLYRSTDGGTSWTVSEVSALPWALDYTKVVHVNGKDYGASLVNGRVFRINPNGPVNLAAAGTIIAFSEQQAGNEAVKAIDGISGVDSNRWSADAYPQWIEIDLNGNKTISSTELDTLMNRAYRFRVEARSETGTYSTIVDRSNNVTAGPITNSFPAVTARYVRLTVTGAYNYTGGWVSIREFKVFGN